MRTLALIHRWLGGVAGLVLALLGLSGTLLVWRDLLVRVPQARDAVRHDPAGPAQVVDALVRAGRPVDQITFPSDRLGVHQIAFADGGGAYISQAGATVASWHRQSDRPELLLFDIHHRLLLGEAGEWITAIGGLIGLFFLVSGVLLWWRTRHRFRPRLWPKRLSSGAIVHHHRDLGIVAAPLLLVSMLTGVLMLFPAATRVMLAPLGSVVRPLPPSVAAGGVVGPVPGSAPLFREAVRRFPDADLRRLQFPRRRGAPVALRVRQAFEWTPNGRTFLYADPRTMRVIGVADPAAGGAANWIAGTLYPVHAGKVGGTVWKLALTVSGVALMLLGSLAVYGFWRTKWAGRVAGRKRVADRSA